MTIWIEHDGGVNPVREGERLEAVRFRSGFEYHTPDDERWTWQHSDAVALTNHITYYAVTPPRATITPPAPMDAAEVLVRAREAVIAANPHWPDKVRSGIRAGEYDDIAGSDTGKAIRAVRKYIEDLSRPLSEVAPHTVVDPDLLEARNLVECAVHWSPQTDRDIAAGKNDATPEMKIAIAAIKRGRELERAGKAAR